MKQQNELAQKIIDNILGLLWGQWTSAGAGTSYSLYRGYVLDPEALICATCYFGRYDARIFDLMIDWMVDNRKLIIPKRLTNISSSFGEETQEVIIAILRFLAEEEGIRSFDVKHPLLEKDGSSEKKILFRYSLTKEAAIPEEYEPAFFKYGFIRPKIELPHISHKPNPYIKENIRFKLRGLFGCGARSEVICYLLNQHSSSNIMPPLSKYNSNSIASAIYQNQSYVHSILQELTLSGLFKRHGAGRGCEYTINKGLADFLTEGKGIDYAVWPMIYPAYEYIINKIQDHPEEFTSEYLGTALYKELAESFSMMLHDSGLPYEMPDASSSLDNTSIEKCFLESITSLSNYTQETRGYY